MQRAQAEAPGAQGGPAVWLGPACIPPSAAPVPRKEVGVGEGITSFPRSSPTKAESQRWLEEEGPLSAHCGGSEASGAPSRCCL